MSAHAHGGQSTRDGGIEAIQRATVADAWQGRLLVVRAEPEL